MVVSVPGWGWGCIGVEVFRAFVAQFSVPVKGWGCILHRQLWAARSEPFPSPCRLGDASESQEEVRLEDLQVSVPRWGWGCTQPAGAGAADFNSFPSPGGVGDAPAGPFCGPVAITFPSPGGVGDAPYWVGDSTSEYLFPSPGGVGDAPALLHKFPSRCIRHLVISYSYSFILTQYSLYFQAFSTTFCAIALYYFPPGGATPLMDTAPRAVFRGGSHQTMAVTQHRTDGARRPCPVWF